MCRRASTPSWCSSRTATVSFEAGKSYTAKAKEVGSSRLELGQVDMVIEEKDGPVVAKGVASVDYRMPARAPLN